jgi:hypothetical protein
MKTAMSMSLLGAVAAMITSVAAVPAIQPLDVWVPKITSPTASTIWHLGHVRFLSFVPFRGPILTLLRHRSTRT